MFEVTFVTPVILSCPKSLISFACWWHLHVSLKKRTAKKLKDGINTSLDNIINLLKASKLIANVKKSNLLVLNVDKSQSTDKAMKLYIDKEILEHKETAKYLGVYLDKWLIWHIDILSISEVNQTEA